MVRFLALFFLIFLFSSCKENELSSKFTIKVNPENPLVINADNIRRSVSFIDGVKVIDTIPVPGPWTTIGFDFRNENNKAITIIALTLDITGPDGKTRNASIFRYDINGFATPIFATVRAENDVNCDGVVDEAEARLVNPILSPNDPIDPKRLCSIDSRNPSFTGARAIIENLLSGVDKEGRELYRNASYQIKARFEGWLGLSTDVPEENFYKEVVFTARTN